MEPDIEYFDSNGVQLKSLDVVRVLSSDGVNSWLGMVSVLSRELVGICL